MCCVLGFLLCVFWHGRADGTVLQTVTVSALYKCCWLQLELSVTGAVKEVTPLVATGRQIEERRACCCYRYRGLLWERADCCCA
jgi:hypothetical protein